MDPTMFDRFVRAFGFGASRRGILSGLFAGLSPFAGLARDKKKAKTTTRGHGETDTARCLANGQQCGKGSGKKGKPDHPCKGCCSWYATPKAKGKRRCSCKPAKTACSNASQCCGGQCTGGTCGPCQPGQTLCQPDGCVNLQSTDAHCGSCGNSCDSGLTCVDGGCTCTAASCTGGVCVAGECVKCDVCASGCTYTSLQTAFDNSPDGATIRLCPGSYVPADSTEFQINFGRNLNLTGAGADQTFIDGEGTERFHTLLLVDSTATSVIRDLTITGGNFTNSTKTGGGLRVEPGGNLTLERVRIEGNQAQNGGGIANFGTLVLDDSHVTDNTATQLGGGIFNSRFGPTLATLTLRGGSTVTGNTAPVGEGEDINNPGVVNVEDGDAGDCLNVAPDGTGCPAP